ncbi:hypothetical protein [Micromonospora sp. NPDC005979]|uniref:hypothetical protein n=1 Tax=Micromonospora sp. NPDC005979 TaxID=3156726 RepID=UPI0033ACAE49
MIRTLVVASLLLAGCSPADKPEPVASPTNASDPRAVSACRYLADALKKNILPPFQEAGAANHAAYSTDPDIRAAGERLGPAAKEVGDIYFRKDPAIDTGPADLRLAEARQGMLAACTKVFGEPPWEFAQEPTPTPSS